MTSHINVVRLQYFREEQDYKDQESRILTLFMDYLPSNLQSIIQEYTTGMPINLIQLYSKQMFSALDHLASQDIVHRDLLPRNILIDPTQNTLKLADFGCAKVVKPGFPNIPNVGAWQYRAIELLFGATCYGSKAGNLPRCQSSYLRYLVCGYSHSGDDVREISPGSEI
jgi:serine/threonine protein kinase